MARKKSQGTPLKVFSGKEAKLNRVILRVLKMNEPLTCYRVYLAVNQIKGFRHTKYSSIDRRMKALDFNRWIDRNGSEKTKSGSLSPLYQLSIKGQIALELDNLNFDDLLDKNNEDLLLDLKKLLSLLR